ncbi:MAG: hypothetical protein LBK53_09235 [Heliobacteriaceae bacterium]|jgi:hypothetical protein|nr:hypothetical protein [Heliobacteriaceae bacterium]
MDLSVLDENIGKPYSQITMGCMQPVYLLKPDLPQYDFNLDINYFLPLVKKHYEEIDINEIKSGDLLMIKVREDYHFAIFKEPNLIYHCTKNSKLRLSRIELYRKYIVKAFRLNAKYKQEDNYEKIKEI